MIVVLDKCNCKFTPDNWKYELKKDKPRLFASDYSEDSYQLQTRVLSKLPYDEEWLLICVRCQHEGMFHV